MNITHDDESITLDPDSDDLNVVPIMLSLEDLADLIEYAVDNALIDDPADKYRWAFDALIETMALIREGNA